jgi:hypothetical protein
MFINVVIPKHNQTIDTIEKKMKKPKNTSKHQNKNRNSKINKRQIFKTKKS